MAASLFETDLYPPVKALLERQGYAVKSEIGACDIMAVRADEPPVIVELKTSFTLPLIYQAIERQKLSDTVYVAVPLPKKGIGTDEISLCRRLGLGLLAVKESWVEPYLDPAPYAPRQNKRQLGRLLKEFHARVGDPNSGGSTRRPLVTAYRQDALRCAGYLGANGASRISDVVQATRVERAASIFRSNVYGWFDKVGRGTYATSPKGREALDIYKDVIEAITSR
jgi:hypothetical protein